MDTLINVTRVEVINENGRAYVRYCREGGVQVEEQDSGKTLKVFIKKHFPDDKTTNT